MTRLFSTTVLLLSAALIASPAAIAQRGARSAGSARSISAPSMSRSSQSRPASRTFSAPTTTSRRSFAPARPTQGRFTNTPSRFPTATSRQNAANRGRVADPRFRRPEFRNSRLRDPRFRGFDFFPSTFLWDSPYYFDDSGDYNNYPADWYDAPPAQISDQTYLPDQQQQSDSYDAPPTSATGANQYSRPTPSVSSFDGYVFVRRDGAVLFASAFAIQSGDVVYVNSEGIRSKIPLSELDVDATRKMNDGRGITISLPN